MTNLPELIRDFSLQIEDLNQEMRQLSLQLAEIDFTLDQAIAWDAELKNEAQRKLIKQGWRNDHPDYSNIERQLADCNHRRELASIHRQYHQDCLKIILCVPQAA